MKRKTPFDKIEVRLPTAQKISKGGHTKWMTYIVYLSKLNIAHTKWNCKYHVVFAPKYRRKIFYGEKRAEIGKILRELCNWKGVNIINAEVCPDHVHMLIEIPPKMSVSGFMGFLKGKSSIMIYEKWGNMKFKYRNRQFWCRGYYVDTVGKNTAAIDKYISNQLRKLMPIEAWRLQG